MKFTGALSTCLCIAVLSCAATRVYAESTIGNSVATVTRFLSITNTSSLEFGTVSIGSTPGSVTIYAQGTRSASGGVAINPSGDYTPAKFVIEGEPNTDFVISLPRSVELRNANGNTIAVDNINSNQDMGRLDGKGSQEISIGGQINLNGNQSSGDYNGVLVVELNYS